MAGSEARRGFADGRAADGRFGQRKRNGLRASLMDLDWQADLARCAGPGRPLLREQSLWALWVYRFGRRVDSQPTGLRRRLQTKLYWLLFRLTETFTGISLPKATRVGGGLRIFHFGGIFVNPATVIGRGCTLRQGVTLGNRVEDGPCPVLEDGVELGAYAQVIGGVRLGAGSRIGALSVVLHDVPAGCTAVGNPARIVGTTRSPASGPLAADEARPAPSFDAAGAGR